MSIVADAIACLEILFAACVAVVVVRARFRMHLPKVSSVLLFGLGLSVFVIAFPKVQGISIACFVILGSLALLFLHPGPQRSLLGKGLFIFWITAAIALTVLASSNKWRIGWYIGQHKGRWSANVYADSLGFSIDQQLRALGEHDSREYKPGPLFASEVWEQYKSKIDITNHDFTRLIQLRLRGVWHTGFTDLYRLDRKKMILYYNGGLLSAPSWRISLKHVPFTDENDNDT